MHFCPENVFLRISIHALREEGDRTRPTRANSGWNFYPRPPRGGRRCVQLLNQRIEVISIHALREEGDRNLCTEQG